MSRLYNEEGFADGELEQELMRIANEVSQRLSSVMEHYELDEVDRHLVEHYFQQSLSTELSAARLLRGLNARRQKRGQPPLRM